MRGIFETICAFLNGHGGTIFIGISDSGKIIGQNVSDNTRREIAREIKKLDPTADINVQYIEIKDNEFIIIINVEAGAHIPYVYDGRPFQRDESATNRMSQHRYEQLLVRRGQLNHTWEEFVADDYDIEWLDAEEIYRTLREGIAERRIPASIVTEDPSKILRQLGLMTEEQKIKRAAVALFAKEITSPYTQCWIKMARFKGFDTTGDFVDNQQIYCNVFRMLHEADDFLRRHLPLSSYFQKNQLKRIDRSALPVLAIREALVNAICHRDYMDRSGYISVAIFDDRVEIWNNGTLPHTLKLEDLQGDHDSILRNQLIAKIFYLRGYIETWGTGTTRMIAQCRENKIPLPKFSERTGGFLVTFEFAMPLGGQKAKKKFELTDRHHQILKLLGHDALNGSQISDKLQDKTSIRMIQKDLSKLEAMGFVKRDGKARAVTWMLVKKP